MSNKIKVSGYSKKEVFNGNIEYRNFSPDLVGLQLTSDGGTPLFSMGNFSITTNMDPKTDKSFITNKFSEYYTLDNLKISETQTQSLLDNNAGVILNLDKSNEDFRFSLPSAYLWHVASEKLEYLTKYFTKSEIDDLKNKGYIIVDKKEFDIKIGNYLDSLH
jgi:hypothetical protein